ncbi:lipopolysaccharide biosynthesis protein [Methylomonas paludis]|uniref:Lipopolysaccharide biosynthesis protein n=1 Tax=Methylomonas paludis TaxID=1173101 RepID=A0A975MN38_9GAMM|nr:lipopolysaccharide biosynthesis protein [Methylomonas paludis]QWF70825.1 lipopolysaccharide biosynthesis protein [Methylomonas paludis]
MLIISNIKWTLVAQAARIISQLANIFILARILAPSDYGTMAMASVVTNLALLLRDQGTSAALIQKENLTDQIITTVFWFNISTGLAIALAIMVLSPAISIYFNQPELIAVLCSLAIVFPLGSSASSHQALLERNSQFKELAIIEIISSLIAMILSIIAACYGFGVYSLVIQAVMMSLLSAIQIWKTSAWRPSGRPSMKALKSILPFTSYMAGSQIISYFVRNSDSAIIGKILGASSLGIYSMAFKVMLLPVQNITWAVSRSLYPIMSRQQDSLKEMGTLYLQTVAFISFLSAPLMAGIFALREPFVNFAFGNKWAEAADVLMWLAPVGYLQSISSTAGVVFMAQGKIRFYMWLTFISGLICVIAFIVGSKWGMGWIVTDYLYLHEHLKQAELGTGRERITEFLVFASDQFRLAVNSGNIKDVAAYYLLATIITILPSLVISTKLVGYSIFSLFSAIWRSVFVSLIVCLVIRYCYFEFKGYYGNPLSEFIILIISGVLLYILLSFVLIRPQIMFVLNKLKTR